MEFSENCKGEGVAPSVFQRKRRVAVIGAGPAGLFFSHLARREGLEVVLFEGHSKPGGCASYFRKKYSKEGDAKALFDAGATVLSLLGEGEWLRNMVSSFGITLPRFHRMNEMEYRLSNLRFTLDARSCESWIQSLAKEFPKDREVILQRFPKMAQQAQRLQNGLQRVPHLPIESWQDIVLNWRNLPSLLNLVPAFIGGVFTSFGETLDSWKISDPLRRWIDMNLLITLQAPSEEVHPLWASLALFFYPLGAGALEGGMNALFEPLLEKLNSDPGAQIFMKTPVTRIQELDDGRFCCVTIDRMVGPFDFVVSSIPSFNTEKLFDSPLFRRNFSWETLQEHLWGAVVSYVVVRDVARFPDEPFNVHSSRASSFASASGGGDVYLSFSARNDLKRVATGYRTLTLSTHAHLTEWRASTEKGAAYRNDPAYLHLKSCEGDKLLQHFRELYPESEIVFFEHGTPSTFARYTRREEGSVGGLPLTQEFTGFRSASQRTEHPGIYQIGDTRFPGQSVLGCAVGAQACLEKILGRVL